uniref:ATP synthase complex subunit 8 n=1 Tax=Scolytinae sp. BMNH 1040174 TaxID=1903786 RepID=A0A343A605_9CUCU|nr:ATP synthase F0 subunit 8 [Scolytinae sp. BMNH 1040174]
MPQMAPISWVTLYIMFTLLFIMTCVMNYYIFLYKPKNVEKEKIKSLYSWKW